MPIHLIDDQRREEHRGFAFKVMTESGSSVIG